MVSSLDGPSTAPASVSVAQATCPLPGSRVPMVGKLLVSSGSYFPTCSRPCAVMIATVSLLDSARNTGAWDTASRASQLAIARRQRDATRTETFYVWSIFHRVCDENDKLALALALFHGPVYRSRLSLLALVA